MEAGPLPFPATLTYLYECTSFTSIQEQPRCVCRMESPNYVTHEIYSASELVEGVSRPPCGCTLILVQESRTQILVVESMALQKPQPDVASHTSLSMFNFHL